MKQFLLVFCIILAFPPPIQGNWCRIGELLRMYMGRNHQAEVEAANKLVLEISEKYATANAEKIALAAKLEEAQIKIAVQRAQTAASNAELSATRNQLMEQIQANLRNDGTPEVFGPLMNNRRLPEIITAASQGRLEPLQIGLLSLDIDKFGSINTSFGHTGGDVLLERFITIVEDVLTNVTRANGQTRQVTAERRVTNDVLEKDYFIRVGGEEFFIYLPNLTPERSIEVAEAIRHRFEKEHLIFAGLERSSEAEPEKSYPADKTNMTVSIGVTQLFVEPNSDVASTKAYMLLAAGYVDEALYHAKELSVRQKKADEAREANQNYWGPEGLSVPNPIPYGRNRVVVHMMDGTQSVLTSPRPVYRTSDFFPQPTSTVQ